MLEMCRKWYELIEILSFEEAELMYLEIDGIDFLME